MQFKKGAEITSNLLALPPNKLMSNKIYGLELVLELFSCQYKIMRSKKKIQEFLVEATKLTGLRPEGRPYIKRFMGGGGWETGYSFFQFLTTSSITGHCIEPENIVFLNIFSCGVFDERIISDFSKKFFRAKRIKKKTIYHKE